MDRSKCGGGTLDQSAFCKCYGNNKPLTQEWSVSQLGIALSKRGVVGLFVIAVVVILIMGVDNYQPVQGEGLVMQRNPGTSPNWESWLTEWNRELLKYFDLARYNHSDEDDDLTPERVASGWLGNPGATENQIVQLESRLGKKLPPSYRTFLKTSNGFRMPGTNISRLQPTEKVEWFRVRNQETINIWKSHGLENLSATLCISAIDFGGGTYFLLNPKVVTSDGEWEALYFDPGKATCQHFPSFWELMQDERRGFLIVEETQAQQMQPDDDLHTVVVKLPNLIKKIEVQEKNPRTRIPNREMEEAIMEYVIRRRPQNADSQSSKKKENADEPAGPAKPQITGTRKKITYETSTYNILISVSGGQQEPPNNRNLEAAYQRYLEYEDGARESLRSAKLRLLEIQTKSNRPEIVSRELVSLKKELNKKYQEYVKNNPWVHDSRSNLHNRESGIMEGCSITAGLIIEFLNEPYAVTWDILKTRIIESIAPKYSSAQSASASVVMIINVHGVVTRAYQSEGDEELGNAVAQALKKWRFHPDLTKGRGFDLSCEVSARLVAGELEFGNGSSGNK